MKPHKRLTVANITSVLALIIALAGTGGAAYALGKNTVGSLQIIDKSVRSADLRSGAADSRTVRKNAVTGSKVRNGSLSGNDLQPKATGMAHAGLTVFDATVRGWFNRVGGKPTVQLQDTGRYLITVPGVDPVSPSDAGPMGGSSGSGIVQVTPVDNLVRACSWVGSPGPGFIVACTIDQSYANTSFSVTVFAE